MKKLQTVLAVLLCLSLIACSQQPTSSQGGGKVILGGGNSMEIPSSAPSDTPPNDENSSQQSTGKTVIETIPQEEQLNYFRKYIEPYYIVGLMYSTWSDPEEIEVEKFMRFFTYNEYENYYNTLEDPLDGRSSRHILRCSSGGGRRVYHPLF